MTTPSSTAAPPTSCRRAHPLLRSGDQTQGGAGSPCRHSRPLQHPSAARPWRKALQEDRMPGRCRAGHGSSSTAGLGMPWAGQGRAGSATPGLCGAPSLECAPRSMQQSPSPPSLPPPRPPANPTLPHRPHTGWREQQPTARQAGRSPQPPRQADATASQAAARSGGASPTQPGLPAHLWPRRAGVGSRPGRTAWRPCGVPAQAGATVARPAAAWPRPGSTPGPAADEAWGLRLGPRGCSRAEGRECTPPP